jgi:hypothetical protein
MTDSRAATTCKADAFAAPFAFLDRAYRQGDNNLTSLEAALASAYDSLGRSDLGDFVRTGKKYQRLTDMLQGCPSGIDNLVGLREAFLGTAKKAPPKTMTACSEAVQDRSRSTGVVGIDERRGTNPISAAI